MSDIATHYGGSVLAIKGKSTIAIFSDRRLGSGSITIGKDHPRIYEITKKLYIALPDFVPDAQMLFKKIRKNHDLFVLNVEREMEPEELAGMISYMLYDKRTSPYIVGPLVVGINKHNKPYICGMDSIGCISDPSDFVCGGTASKNIAVMCEALYSEDLEDEELFVMGAQAFLNAVDRDALSGWGLEGILIKKDTVTKRRLRMRQD